MSGVVQVQVMVDGAPDFTDVGLAEHEACGGFFGRSLTVKLALQLAVAFLLFGSLTFAVNV